MSANFIRGMPTKALLRTINKIRKEKEHKKQHGDYGTGKYVSESEFYHGSHAQLKAELQRRKSTGMIKSSAGKPRKKRMSMWNIGGF